jgi:cytochrome c oxidase subunit 4
MPAQRATSPIAYFAVFGALLALTALTFFIAQVPLGSWHTPVALAIAATKATLVVLIFMHARHSSRLTWIVIGAALFWLAIMLSLTLADYMTRDWTMG